MSSDNRPRVHVFGGTSDALVVCRQLEQRGVHYSLSVATEVGYQLAQNLKGEIIVGRMNSEQMLRWLEERGIEQVIDATHPFAELVSNNARMACNLLEIDYQRIERPSDIDSLQHPLLFKVDSIEQACLQAAQLGHRIFLTTGSKNLADYRRWLIDKHLIVRVLPTVDVLEHCQQLGLTIEQIIAIKGPFSAEMNRAMYRDYQVDVVITKESGRAGGYQDKVTPCLALGIPCVVILRPVAMR